ncbi:MFS transporter [Dickeya dadantii subsp. dieffenbachiae]|uniref:MFS transporter n=1 Tax=Dickeya dadantii TaxID=204038 RepID=UPI00039FA7EB|nr:MFS transporter [Dickeya dadantii]
MFKLIPEQSSFFLVTYVLNAMNNWAFKFIAPLALYAETQSLQMMTVSYGLLFTPNIISPPIINLIDGKLKRKSGLLGLNMMGGGLCVFGFFYFKQGFNIAAFLIMIFLLSTTLTLFQTLIHSTMKNMLSEKIAIENMSRRLAFFDSLFPAMGPLIGATLLSVFSYSTVFLIIAVVYGTSMMNLGMVQINEEDVSRVKGSFINRTTRGFSLIRTSPFVNFLMKRFFLSNIALHGFQSVLTFYLIDRFNLSALNVGFFFAASALGLMVGSRLGRLIYAHEINKWYVIASTGIVCALCLIITPLMSNVIIPCLAWCVVMLLSSINLIVFYTERQVNFRQADTASVIAASYVIIYSAIPLGSALSFILARYFNAGETLLILGGYLLLIGFYFLYLAFRKQKVLMKEMLSDS